MKTSLFRTTAATLLATSTLFVATLEATAQPNDNSLMVQTRVVSYADLDLQSEAGVAKLNARIVGAAKAVCGDDGFAPIATYVARDKCRAKAIADAISTVNLAQLSRKSPTDIELAQR